MSPAPARSAPDPAAPPDPAAAAGRAGRSLLIITTLDVAGRANNREHHLVGTLGAGYDRVVVVYRRRGRRTHPWRDLLAPGRTVRQDGRVTWVAVNPMLNAPEGAAQERLAADPAAGPVRRAVGVAVDALAILRDMASVVALTLAAARAAPPARETACEALGPWAAAAADMLRATGRLTAYAYVDRDYEPGFMRSGLRRVWAAAMEARAARRADLTLCIGERLAALRSAVPGARVALSPTGVAASAFPARLRERPLPEVIFLGRVAEWSGVEEGMEAVALLRAQDLPARLLVLGPAAPAYRALLLARAAGFGLGDAFRWPGEAPHAEAAAALDGAAIGLSVFRPAPLRIYAAPLKLLEYMAAGLPSLALAGSEAGDLVARTGAGLAVAADPAAIAGGVRALVADPERYRAMSKAALATAAAHDWTAVLERERALLDAMVAERAR